MAVAVKYRSLGQVVTVHVGYKHLDQNGLNTENFLILSFRLNFWYIFGSHFILGGLNYYVLT